MDEPLDDKMKFQQPTVLDLLADERKTHEALLLRWATKVFDSFDTDKDGKLDAKELAASLQKLPKMRPFSLPPGTKMLTVDELIATLDGDGDQKVSKAEWVENLGKCVGLAHCLSDNMDENGNLPGFN